ncbi:MAG: tetracycline resistance MFS efflux pump [Candidatus Roseilinea sp.]|nr:MAG: tetracycline resistance MFS efflux pump [Candidatus Roseilinea sp.]
MSRLLPVFVIVLVDLLGLTIIVPLLPLYAASFGANPFMVGLLGATYPIMQTIGAPILGRLSDQFGRKPVLIVSQIGTFIGFVLMGLANALPLLFVARVIDGLSGANIATAQAVITDNTTEEHRTQGLALIGAAFGIGFTIGPAVAFAALSLSGNHYQAPAFLAAAFSLLSLLLTIFWLKESLPAELRGRMKRPHALSPQELISALRHPMVGFLLALMFAQQFIFGGMEQLLSLFTLNRLGFDARANALLFVFIGLITVAMLGGVIRVWSRRYGDRWIILVGLATLTVGMLMTALTPRVPPPWYSRAALLAELQRSATAPLSVALPPDGQNGWLGVIWIFAAMIPASIGGSVLAPTINSAITKRIEATEVGGMLGVSAALVSAANALAPLVGGALYQTLGESAPFLIGGLVLIGLFALATREISAPAVPATP